jgi:hypothetical protein
MTPRPVFSVVLALAAKVVLDRLRRPARPRLPEARRPPAPPAPAPRRALLALMLSSLVAGVGLMLGFEAPLMRVLGVLALFAFIVSGVFLIADPASLQRDEG